MITFKVETEREDDGRWLAEVLENLRVLILSADTLTSIVYRLTLDINS